MENFFNYKQTKKEMLNFIQLNKGQLATVELDPQDNYTNINVELYPSGKVLTYCKVETKSKDFKVNIQLHKFASVLDDYISNSK